MIKENAEYHIAILGFGTVGKGVYDIIKNSSNAFLDNIDVEFIYVREDKIDELSKKYDDVTFTSNLDEIFEDECIDIVVECLGGNDLSFRSFLMATKNGKDFVTSNKLLLATKFDNMIEKTKETLINLNVEATVGGGVHIFHSIADIKKVDNISGFIGIINGTTNYILTKMFIDNSEYIETLENAKRLGLAESDPSSDIDGLDAKYKTVILMNYIFNISVELDSIINMGIRYILKKDIDFAKKNDKTIKLISCGDTDNAFVMPMFIDKNDNFYSVNLNNNAIDIFSDNLGSSTYMGQGAGSLPTAHSVVLDIVDITSGNGLFWDGDYEKKIVLNNLVGRFYIRGKNINKYRDIISEIIDDDTIITKELSIRDLYELVKNDESFVAKI